MGPSEPGVDPAWTDDAREELAGAMAALSGTARRYANGLPPDPTDPLTILAETGNAPTAILAWIADQTRLVPYVGSLRGSRGVLADRAGNSLDRSLALALLLTDVGEEVRLARATLTDDKAQALLTSTERTVDVPSVPHTSRDDLVAMLSDPRLPPDVVEAAATEAAERRDNIVTLVTERTDALLPILLDAVSPNADAANAAARASALSALSDHYWVQVRTGATWQDFDPDGDIVGQLEPTETLDPSELPDDRFQSVTLRLIVELQDSSGRREEQLLTWTGRPADLDGQVLTLTHAGNGMDALGQLVQAGVTGDQVMQVIDGVDAWTPILRVGGDIVIDKLFTQDGAIRDANLIAFAQTGGAAGALFAEVAGILGGSAPPATEPAVPTAEWLEIEADVPGQPAEVERRTIFDLIGPAARASGVNFDLSQEQRRVRALSLAGATDILILGATPNPIQVARTASAAIAEIADNIGGAAATPQPPNLDYFPPGPRVAFSLLQFAAERLAGHSDEAIASPNVFLMHQRFALGLDGEASLQSEIDIVFNAISTARDPFTASVRQGLVDTVLEDAIVGGTATGNTSALHAADLASGRSWHVLGQTEVAALAPGVQPLIQAQMKAGFVLLAPQSASPQVGWWRIDPDTGTTIGITATGGGAAMVGEAFLVFEGVTTGMCFVGMALAIRAIIGDPAGGYTFGLVTCMAAGGFSLAGTGLLIGYGGVIFILTLGAGAAAMGW